MVEEVPGNWEWAKDGEAEDPCEVRESLRQVEKAQGKVRKPQCQKKGGLTRSSEAKNL